MALVLAIEPDARQASAVSRVVKDRVGAELVLVDSKDRAIAAINARVPDLILIPALFSPRDEEDLVVHLRSLQGADHLQTLTIPLLGSSRREDRPRRGGGGLFGRRKDGDSAPDGCDPGVFAEQIAGYLKTATEVKAAREAAAAYSARFEEPVAGAEPQAGGSPTQAPTQATAWLAPEGFSDLVFEPLHPLESVLAAPTAPVAPQAEAPVEAPPEPYVEPQPEPYVEPPAPPYVEVRAEPQPEPPAEPTRHRPLVGFTAATLGELLAREREIVSGAQPSTLEPAATNSSYARRLPPLAMWARVPAAAGQSAPAKPDASAPFDVGELLNMLKVPPPVATISYARGCRVRRVHVAV